MDFYFGLILKYVALFHRLLTQYSSGADGKLSGVSEDDAITPA